LEEKRGRIGWEMAAEGGATHLERPRTNDDAQPLDFCLRNGAAHSRTLQNHPKPHPLDIEH